MKPLLLALADPKPIQPQEEVTLALRAELEFRLVAFDFAEDLRHTILMMGVEIAGRRVFTMQGLPLELFQRDADAFAFQPVVVPAGAMIRIRLLNVGHLPVSLLDHTTPSKPEKIWLVGEVHSAPSFLQ